MKGWSVLVRTVVNAGGFGSGATKKKGDNQKEVEQEET